MPKFNVGIIATVDIEVEADTQEEEAEALAIAKALASADDHLTAQLYDFLRSISDNVRLNDAEWNIDYCEKLDEDNA